MTKLELLEILKDFSDKSTISVFRGHLMITTENGNSTIFSTENKNSEYGNDY